ncbi:hypothetical protein BDP27DRAFT_1334490, partial [Rhodocollybia butyracea]
LNTRCPSARDDRYEIAQDALGESRHATMRFISITGHAVGGIESADTRWKKTLTEQFTAVLDLNAGDLTGKIKYGPGYKELGWNFFIIYGPLLPRCLPCCFGWIRRGVPPKDNVRGTLHLGLRIGIPQLISTDGPEVIIGKPESESLRREWDTFDGAAGDAVHQQQPGGHVYDPQLGPSVHNQHQGVPAHPQGQGHQAAGHLPGLVHQHQGVPPHQQQQEHPVYHQLPPVPNPMSFDAMLNPEPHRHPPGGSTEGGHRPLA